MTFREKHEIFLEISRKIFVWLLAVLAYSQYATNCLFVLFSFPWAGVSRGMKNYFRVSSVKRKRVGNTALIILTVNKYGFLRSVNWRLLLCAWTTLQRDWFVFQYRFCPKPACWDRIDVEADKCANALLPNLKIIILLKFLLLCFDMLKKSGMRSQIQHTFLILSSTNATCFGLVHLHQAFKHTEMYNISTDASECLEESYMFTFVCIYVLHFCIFQCLTMVHQTETCRIRWRHY